MLLQILEDSRLTDNTGRVVSFKNTVIIMTSNVGAKLITDKKKLGFVDQSKENQKMEYESTKKEIMQELKREFSPEFINRIDEIIIFKKLSKEVVYDILEKIVKEIEKRLEDKHITLELTNNAKDYIINNSYDEIYGARPIKRFVSRNLETLLAEKLINDEIKFDSKIIIDIENDEFVLKNVA